MNHYNLYKFTSVFLILLAISSYFFGFYFDENSAGAGHYQGDIVNVWKNLQIFLTNDIISSIQNQEYYSSRTPLVYIFHEIFNPFTKDIESFRKSVFVISLTLPILFYFCLRQKFVERDNILLLLISATVFLSPYFRTSAFWGLEENFGLIFLLLSFLFLNSFLKNENHKGYKVHFLLFLLIFSSSCCIYFDQKLTIIPAICFFKIIKSDKLIKFKLLSFFYYFLFSLPYIYLIILWGGLIPTSLVAGRKLGSEIFLVHIGYSTTIIAFYLLPLLFFKNKSILNILKDSFSDKKNYFLVGVFTIYIFYLIGFFDLGEQSVLGKGIVHKISLILFDENFFRTTFVYFSFFISWIIILLYIEFKFIETICIAYFFMLSAFSWPIHQEYFDPLILLMAFTFFGTKIYLSYRNSIALFIYLLIFFTSTNIYYSNLLD